MSSHSVVRRWLQYVPIERDGLSWAVSLGVHLVLLVLLALVWQTLPDQTSPQVELSSVDAGDAHNDLQEVDYSASNTPTEEIGGGSGLEGQSIALPASMTLGEIGGLDGEQGIPTDAGVPELPVMTELSTGSSLNDKVSVRGDAGVGVKGAEGAVDRITQEILVSLDAGPTLVVWLMDQSESLQPQRAAIEQRLDGIYNELGVIQSRGKEAFRKHGDQPLLTAVVAFGQEISFRTKEPTDDLAEIKKAIRDIPRDESGIELTFTAVTEAARKYQKLRSGGQRRSVLLIVVTDEAGNDQQQLETAIEACKKGGKIPVYVIGVPAPFGQRQAFVKYVDPDPQFAVQDLPVDQGPESAMAENVQIGFTGRGGDRHTALDSGFGPYALTRLCVATQGVYFAVHPNRPTGAGKAKDTAAMATRISEFFDPTIMRNYSPDYIAPRQYEQLLKENKARVALVQAAALPPIDQMDNPRMKFPKRNEAELKREFDVAQRAAAVIEPKIDEMLDTLKRGEKDRNKLVGARWQAGFDLAMGRVLALKVRTFSYNTILAKAEGGMKFEKPNSDTWVLSPANDIVANNVLERMAAQSREYLTRVKTEHPGTPWASLAERELSLPLGWKWSEEHTGVEEQARMNNGGGPGGPPQDRKRVVEKEKPVRQNVKL